MSFAKRELCAVCGALIHQDKAIKVKLKKKAAVVCSDSCKDKWEEIWKK